MQPLTPLTFLFAAIIAMITVPAAPAASTTPWASHIQYAASIEHPLAEPAARFLAEHAPPRDADLDVALLNENLELALRARDEFLWSGAIPEHLFLNDVLPYASLDETRERWRPALYAISKQIVKDAKTAGEAAQRLNEHLFNTIGVHYNTGRKRANQSVFESMKQGHATCTGLSIILVNACRSVGVPARIAGVAEWVSTPGNHTWIEIWDGERWRFTGADEYNANGLDRAWFNGRAAKAEHGSTAKGVWTTSWRTTGNHFPMAWSRADRTVHGVEVTARYAPMPASETDADDSTVTRFFRVWNREGGERVPAIILLHAKQGERTPSMQTRSGQADLNDMPSATVTPGTRQIVDITTDDLALRTRIDITESPTQIVDIYLDRLVLTEREAQRATRHAIDVRTEALRAERRDEHDNASITIDGVTLRYQARSFGNEDNDDTQRPLWISLHGGGGAPPEVNERQWQNQIRLYDPAEGLYVAPRAPTDTWNLWHRPHIDPLFDRLIENMVLFSNVDPNRVYLMGYSAGGDGVYQLAPRMADRFAAAAMMAGHPNEARPLSLRNLPFAIYMGADDSAYDRNVVAKQWGEQLQALQGDDPAGYEHTVTIYEGLGHWMEGKDAEALPWMLERQREAWPDRVVWYQDDVVGHRLYWLAVRQDGAERGQTLIAQVLGQTIVIEAEHDAAPEYLTLRLHDELIDLDQTITVTVNDAPVFTGRVARTKAAIEHDLDTRFDPSAPATAVLEIRLH